MSPLGDQDCEMIQGGGRGRGEDLSRHQRKDNKPSSGGGRGLPFANIFIVNIYQFNVAVNTILGGTGNSIANFQANGSTAS
jgi:hypothetical protein